MVWERLLRDSCPSPAHWDPDDRRLPTYCHECRHAKLIWSRFEEESRKDGRCTWKFITLDWPTIRLNHCWVPCPAKFSTTILRYGRYANSWSRCGQRNAFYRAFAQCCFQERCWALCSFWSSIGGLQCWAQGPWSCHAKRQDLASAGVGTRAAHATTARNWHAGWWNCCYSCCCSCCCCSCAPPLCLVPAMS